MHAVLAWLSFTSALKHLWSRADDLIYCVIVALVLAAMWQLIGGEFSAVGSLRDAARRVQEEMEAGEHRKRDGWLCKRGWF